MPTAHPMKCMYQLRLLDNDDLPSLIALHQRSLRDVGRGTERVPLTKKFTNQQVSFEQVISGSGFIIGTFVSDDLIGYATLRYPQADEENLVTYAGLPDVECSFIAHVDASRVAPAHRGLGLSSKMAAVRAQVARDLGVRHLLSVVHGNDLSGLHGLFTQGFKVRGLKQSGQEYLLILHCGLADAGRPIKFEADIRATDAIRQREYLARGHIGYSLNASGGENYIRYGRLIGEPQYELRMPSRMAQNIQLPHASAVL